MCVCVCVCVFTPLLLHALRRVLHFFRGNFFLDIFQVTDVAPAYLQRVFCEVDGRQQHENSRFALNIADGPKQGPEMKRREAKVRVL